MDVNRDKGARPIKRASHNLYQNVVNEIKQKSTKRRKARKSRKK